MRFGISSVVMAEHEVRSLIVPKSVIEATRNNLLNSAECRM
jgi:hypothetical protein